MDTLANVSVVGGSRAARVNSIHAGGTLARPLCAA
jgi:hypothetical protein